MGWSLPGNRSVPVVPALLSFLQDPEQKQMSCHIYVNIMLSNPEDDDDSGDDDGEDAYSWASWTSRAFLSIFSVGSLEDKYNIDQ